MLVLVTVIVIVAASLSPASAAVRNPAIYCGACKGLFDEVEYTLSQVDPRKTIDIRSVRLDADELASKRPTHVNYARSETHLTEVFEKVCIEMKNYSNFEDDDGVAEYKRYNKRFGEKGPLKLKNFGWSVDVQDQLRLACDAILADLEDDVLDFYRQSKDLTVKAYDQFCKKSSWCKESRKINKQKRAAAATKRTVEAAAKAAQDTIAGGEASPQPASEVQPAAAIDAVPHVEPVVPVASKEEL